MASEALRRTGLLAAGLAMGLALVALALWLYLRAAQVGQLETALEARLNLPAEALELEEISPEGRLRIALRDVVLIGEAGDTIAAVPLLSLWFDPQSLSEPGPIVFTEVLLREPYLRLVQTPAGEWNIFRAFEVRAAGEELEIGEEEAGRAVLFRDVEVVDGNVVLAMPMEPVDTASFAARLQLPTERLGGNPYRVFRFRDVDAVLPMVRMGGEEGWRAEVAGLDARLAEPDLRIEDLQMQIASAGEDAVEFEVDLLDLGPSQLAGGGRIRFAEAGPVLDVELRAAPLAFATLQPLLPTLPAEGEARFALDIETVEPGRVALDFQGLEVSAPGVQLGGRLGAVVGGEAPAVFRDTRLDIAELQLQALERFGLVDSIPVAGTVSGVVETAGPVTAGLEGGLQVDLTARIAPRGQPGAEPSVVSAVGGVALGGGEQPFRLEGLQLQLRPLRLATLAELLPEQQERLRGEVQGAVTLTGTPRDLRFEGGALTYQVGDAPPTRLTGLEGQFALDPEVRYEVRARAQPLALATLTELFPGLPFRTATLSGPIRVSGTGERVEFGADLEGPAGALDVTGNVALGETPRFEVSGRVEALTPSALVRAELPVEGPLTGTFGLRGTPEDVRFEVDLEQAAGRFALSGRLRQAGGAPQFEVAGQVADFRLGALIGRPGLFPEPLSGAVDLRGGGREPYRFDVDLRGDSALVDVEGFYAPDGIPEYAVSGQVRGLDLEELPFPGLPRSDLNATIRLQGRGRTLETLAGQLVLDAEGSTIGGIPVDALRLDAAVEDGILVVDTLALVLRDTRLSAEGMWGLTRPAPRPLEYSFSSPDLSTFARLFAATRPETEIAGALAAEGWVAGTFRAPEFAASVRGSGLRYNDWAAARLVGDVRAAREPTGWRGEGSLAADNVRLATGETIEAVRLEANGDEEALAVGLFLRRDGEADVALAGLVEFDERVPRGLVLESLDLNVGDSTWSLASSAAVRWGGVEGIAIDSFLLQQVGGEGLVEIDGVLPPTGTTDLLVRVRQMDLRVLRRLAGNAPQVEGTLALEMILNGPVADPEFRLEAVIDSLRYQGAEADSVTITAAYDDLQMVANAEVWTAAEQLVGAEARVPMSLSLEGLLPSVEVLSQGPVFARVDADSLDLSLITAAVPTLAEGAGSVSAQLRVQGTIDDPLVDGWAAVYDGAVRVLPLGVRYERIAGRFFLEEDQVVIESLTAYNDGRVAVEGTIRLDDLTTPNVHLLADFASFEVMSVEDVARVQLTGNLALSGRFPQPVLTGSVTVLESTIHIPELDERSGVEIADVEIGQVGADTLGAAGPAPGLLANVRVDQLTVNVGEDVWLVSDDARIQIGGELVVYRTGEDLRLFGALQAVRGSYALQIGPLVREFEIRSGRVQFFGTGDLNPELDIVATNRVRTLQSGTTTPITVVVNITGTVQFPRIQLTSDTRPPLPESEILSLLLFGRPSFELGGATGALAQEVLVQEALGGILFAPLEQIFLSSGLVDYVQFRSVGNRLSQVQESLGLTTVEVGTELSDDVFLTLECGIGFVFGAGGTNCGTRLQFDLGRNFTASAAYEPIRRDRILQLLNPNILEYQWSLELRRRWEFGITEAPSVLEEPAGFSGADGASRLPRPGGRETGR